MQDRGFPDMGAAKEFTICERPFFYPGQILPLRPRGQA